MDAMKHSQELLATCQCILAAATDGDVELSVRAIAKRTGLTDEVVDAVLASSVYRDLLERESVRMISHTLLRGVREMDAIVNDERASDADRIAARRAMVSTYQAVTRRSQIEKPPELEDWARNNSWLASPRKSKRRRPSN